MNRNLHGFKSVIIIMLAFFTANVIAQTNIQLPRTSNGARVSVIVGFSEFTINYSSPAVNNRAVWGELVPFGQVWRAGANENTTVSFSDPAKINGQNLPAGNYGFHVIPDKDEWTLIFSKMSVAWGSFSYDESEDALRIKVKPEAAPFAERLIYYFKDMTNNSAIAVLHWEKLQVSFKIEIDDKTLVFQNIQEQLRSLARFSWQGWNQAANWCLQNKVYQDQAMTWVDRSIGLNENFTNLNTKSGLLRLMGIHPYGEGNSKEADALFEKGLSIANENDLNNYGYQLINQRDLAGAIKIFKMNSERYPGSWNTYDSLGEAYDLNGQKDLALEFYTKANSMVKDETQKKRIEDILKRLKAM